MKIAEIKAPFDGTAQPAGVSATAAVGQAQASGDEKKPLVDISKYEDYIDSLEYWGVDCAERPPIAAANPRRK